MNPSSGGMDKFQILLKKKLGCPKQLPPKNGPSFPLLTLGPNIFNKNTVNRQKTVLSRHFVNKLCSFYSGTDFFVYSMCIFYITKWGEVNVFYMEAGWLTFLSVNSSTILVGAMPCTNREIW